MNDLTDFTRATLLLTCQLRLSHSLSDTRVLTYKQYSEVIDFISKRGESLDCLVGANSEPLLKELENHFNDLPFRNLLVRGFQLAQALDLWASIGLWVIATQNSGYPSKLLAKVGQKSPPFLVGAGSLSNLNQKSLGVVGSRSADKQSLELAHSLGRFAAEISAPIISGGARGVDQTAMQGALESGGVAVGIVADSLAKLVVQDDARDWINNDQLTFISVQDPYASFSIGGAMQRNKYIYALSDAAVVVESDFEKGGTWAGAIEQIKTLHYANVFVPSQVVSKGVSELRKAGARDFEAHSGDDLRRLFEAETNALKPTEVKSEQLTIF